MKACGNTERTRNENAEQKRNPVRDRGRITGNTTESRLLLALITDGLCAPLVRARPVSNGMDDDTVNPGGATGEGDVEGEEKESDPDMAEDTFDDVDNL